MKTILDNPFLRYLAVALICFSLLMVTGCSGCRDKDDTKAAKKKEDEKKKKKKKKPDYESRRAVILPGYFHKPKTPEEIQEEKENPAAAAINALNRPSVTKNRTKLGHWVTSNFQAIANNYNAEGQLTTYSQTGTNTPVRIPSTDYYISSSRPVSLPKGEWKNFETTVFLPTRSIRTRSASINYQISRNTSGLPQIQSFDGSLLMKPHQFHFLILSTRPDNYKFLEFADSIRLRGSRVTGGRIDPFYLIVPSIPGDPLPLPRHALNWTTIAYMVWDDYDPDLLEPEHKQAILDWIHFGGQLIVSGPDSLDKLQNSFLAEYLPAHFERSRNLTGADIKELNENWTVKLKRNAAEKRTLQISNSVPLLGVDFKPHDDAEFIDGTGGIAIERKLGRGRIVITAFSLNAPTIRKWRSFKSFFNGALLRKPARNFGKVRNDEDTIVFEWVDDATSIFDPLLGSTLRFLSRDLSRNGTEKTALLNAGVTAEDDAPLDTGYGGFGGGYNYQNENPHLKIVRSKKAGLERNMDNHRYYGGFQDAPQSGVSGWNDRSGISHAARNTLKLAAGIKPPSSNFVLKMLAAYLLVLVPLNWIIFRLIGRVEYAWIAAPLIAIAGAFLVIKFASLDIGFVRSNTQVGVLEIQADYSRAHLAEYSALYTSLSTRYSAELDNLTAQTLPFAIDDDPENFQAKESLSEVQLRRTVKNRLEGFQIQSNTTGLVHTEYLLDLTGIVSFVPPKSDDAQSGSVSNSTNINITNAGVVGRTKDGEYRVAWVGDLAAGNESDLSFSKTTINDLKKPWLKIPVFSNTQRAAAEIWKNNVEDAKSITLDKIRSFPELSSRWEDYNRLFLKSNDRKIEFEDVFSYTQEDFEQIYQSVNSNTEISIGRMFDAVSDNLTIAPGEYRLIGSSNQRLGKTKFDPDSTQVEQQTLVVVHLQHPDLPVAKPDLNSLEEFKSGRSNLDVEEEQKLLKEEILN